MKKKLNTLQNELETTKDELIRALTRLNEEMELNRPLKKKVRELQAKVRKLRKEIK